MNPQNPSVRPSGSLKDRLEAARSKATREIGGSIVIVTNIANSLDMRETAAKLKQIHEKLKEDTFKIIVVGRFKNGKSTFMNALLGRINGSALGLDPGVGPMPTNDLPTTATLTSIQYSDRPMVRVLRFDGKHETWSFERDMRDSRIRPDESENSFFDQIEEFQVHLPAELCKSGVILLDSPGTDEDPKRTAITVQAIEKCDAAIVMFASQPLLGESERQFAAQIRGSHLFTVINMMHGRKPDGQFSAFVWNKLMRDGGKGDAYAGQDFSKSDIYFVDALKAEQGKLLGDGGKVVESGMQQFETRLADFLLNDRYHAHLNTFVTRADAQNAAVESAISQRIAGLSRDQQELETAARQVEPQLLAIDKKLERLPELFASCRSKTKRDAKVAFIALTNELQLEIPRVLERHSLAAFKGFIGGIFPQIRQKAAVIEAAEIAKQHVVDRLNAWGTNPPESPGIQQMITPYIDQLLDEINREITSIDRDFASLHLNLTKWQPSEMDASASGPSQLQRAIALGAGVVLGDLGLVVGGGMGGIRGLAGTLSGYVGSALLLTAFGISGPIALIGVIVGGILGGGFGVRLGAENRVKAEAAKYFTGELAKLRQNFGDVIEQKIDEGFSAFEANIMNAVTNVINTEKRNIRQIIDDNRRSQAQKAQLRGQLEDSRKSLAAQRKIMADALAFFKQQG